MVNDLTLLRVPKLSLCALGLFSTALALLPRVVTAQRQEFTQQTLMVAPLHPLDAASVRSARQLANALRNTIARRSVRRELFVVDTDTIEILLQRAGFRYDTVMGEEMTLVVARRMRADEVVLGSVSTTSGQIEVKAQLALMRDWRLRQPLPVIRGTTVKAVTDSLAAEVLRARLQLAGLRRCENSARAGNPQAAMRFAEEAIRLYPTSTLARTCLTTVLRFNDVGPEVIARTAGELLAFEPGNIVAAALRANALSTLGRPEEEAAAWENLIALRPDSLALATAATSELMRLQRHQAVLRVTQSLLAIHEGDLPLRRLRFRAHIALSAWRDARALGDSLTIVDDDFDSDSTYTARHVESLRLSGDTLAALSRSARAVRQHPGDLSLYLQYLSLVNAEHSTALPRGLSRFPESSELNVLAAREAVTGGRRRAAISSLGTAVRQDPLLTQGHLQIAELWFEEQQPDSAIAAILRAPRTQSQDLLRAYAVSRGRQMVRGASDTATTVWQRAIVLFALADSLDSQDDSRSLLVVASLSLARAELVLGIPAKSCPAAQRANQALALSDDLLKRGAGNDGDNSSMQEMFTALRTSVDHAVRTYCPPSPDP